jgi:DNA-binding protein H-NS
MNIDLDNLSVQELKDLQKEIPKAIKRVGERRKQEARAELEARAKELGFSLPELLDAGRKGKSAEPRFAHPDNPSVTWSGRGRKPKWFSDAVAKGKKPEDMAI